MDGRKRRWRGRNGITGSQFPRPLFSLAQGIEERLAGRNRDDFAARIDAGRAGTRAVFRARLAIQFGEFRRRGSSRGDRALRVHA